MSLASNNYLYELSLAAALRAAAAGNGAAACTLAEMTARFALFQHPGRFADGSLENPLLDIGEALKPAAVDSIFATDAAKSRSLTLHVATEVYATGGHTRVLTKWMQRDTMSSHGLILTRQRAPIPKFFSDRWSEIGVKVIVLDPDETVEKRAAALLAHSRGAQRIILHQHPDDAVPILAYARRDCAPVILFNHAHFTFSMGTAVADLVINTLPYYGAISECRRAARRVDYLTGPIGLEPITATVIDKAAAKRSLGLPEQSPVAMTIGHESYFKSQGGADISSVALDVLKSRGDSHFVFVGVTQECAHLSDALRRHERARFMGPVPDPTPYYRAADICLESFPVPSLGAVHEAISYGEAYPILSYCENENILRPNMPELPRRSRSESEYLTEICQRLDAIAETRTLARGMRESRVQSDVTYGDQFARLYSLVEAQAHSSKPIPRMTPRSDPDDVAMAEVHGDQFGKMAKSIKDRMLRLRCLGGGVLRGYITASEFGGVLGEMVQRAVGLNVKT